MQALTVRIRPLSAFGTPLRGDTLFGQLCWALRRAEGEHVLDEALRGYTDGQPFLVVADAFPAGHYPLPPLPLSRYDVPADVDRKRLKRRRWIAAEDIGQPVEQWLARARSDEDICKGGIWNTAGQPHNSIHRQTGTTGSGMFAPYLSETLWPGEDLRLDIHLLVDEGRLEPRRLVELLADVGQTGYGRDASIGLGKFAVEEQLDAPWPSHGDANAWLTLAPCAPQGLAWREDACFYRPFTRFGRHGDLAVQTGKPFKTPVLLADSGALLAPQGPLDQAWTGQGLGGDGRLSRSIEATVHQGYAPVLAIRLEEGT